MRDCAKEKALPKGNNHAHQSQGRQSCLPYEAKTQGWEGTRGKQASLNIRRNLLPLFPNRSHSLEARSRDTNDSVWWTSETLIWDKRMWTIPRLETGNSRNEGFQMSEHCCLSFLIGNTGLLPVLIDTMGIKMNVCKEFRRLKIWKPGRKTLM